MIDYIHGDLVTAQPDSVVLETQGMGYRLAISLQTFKSIQDQKRTKLYVHEHIRENAYDLYGFFLSEERDLFEHLLSVSGVGPNTARVALSTYSVAELAQAIRTEDVESIKKIKGIGAKTAMRIILDLKDKIIAVGDVEAPSQDGGPQSELHTQAIGALMALGFSRKDAASGIRKVLKEENQDLSVEDLIRKTLQKI